MKTAHEIEVFSARVAHYMETRRASFTDEEMLFIETAYEVGEHPSDTAYFLLTARVDPLLVVEDEE